MEQHEEIANREYQLSSIEIEKIKAEEIFRKRILNELKEEPKQENKILKFFNSPLGLFILSSILLTTISNLISGQINQGIKNKELKTEAIRQLNELDFRISMIEFTAKKIDTAQNFGFKQSHCIMMNWFIIGDPNYVPTDEKFQKTRIINIIAWLKYNIEGLRKDEAAYEKMKMFETYRDNNWIYDMSKVKDAIHTLNEFLKSAQFGIEKM